MNRVGTALALVGIVGLSGPAFGQGLQLVRWGAPGEEKPGLIDSEGNLRDLSESIGDFDPTTLGELGRLAAIDEGSLPPVPGQPRLGVPVTGVGKIVAIGFNYRDHAAEMTQELPKEPLVFMKATSALSGPYDEIVAPRGHTQLDYEAELALVIGKTARYIDAADALDHVAGFMVGHDVSERAWQRERGGQFVKGKSADTFAPLGPWLVTPEAIDDVQSLEIWSVVNGEKRQESNTEYMIFGVAEIVSYVSQFMTLRPGDVIFTGTPAGVGAGMDPPRFLKPGDVVEIGVESLGRQKQTIAAPQ